MAISTRHSYFMYKDGETWKKLFDFKTDPDQSSAPEQLETTTQSDNAHTYIEGLKGNDQRSYTLNYDWDLYKKLYAMRDQEYDLAEWFGAGNDDTTPDGHDGKFQGKGTLMVYWNGGDANTVRDMTVVVTPSQPFDPVEDTLG